MAKIKVITSAHVEGELVIRHDEVDVDTPIGKVFNNIEFVHSVRLYRKDGGLITIFEREE